MTLVEAFQSLAVVLPGGDPEGARAAEGARLLLDFLERRARSLVRRWSKTRAATDDEIDDAVQTTLLKLAQGGARRVVERSLCEGDVERYVARALLNNVVDQLGARLEGGRLGACRVVSATGGEAVVPGDEAEEQEVPGREEAPPSERLVAEETIEAFESLVLPAAEAGIREDGRDGFRRAVHELFDLAYGRIGVEEALAAPVEASPGMRRATADALYQRHTRARRRLLETVRGLRRIGAISEDLGQSLSGVIANFLNRCPAPGTTEHRAP